MFATTASVSYFTVVNDVSESWDKVKQVKDYETVLGKALFNHFLRTSDDAKGIFSFFEQRQMEQSVSEIIEDDAFLKFARKFVRMFDLAVHMLGPDMELVEEHLLELGSKHVAYGVMPKHFPLMGQALLKGLEEVLGDKLTPKARESWDSIYNFISNTMIQGAFEDLLRGERV